MLAKLQRSRQERVERASRMGAGRAHLKLFWLRYGSRRPTGPAPLTVLSKVGVYGLRWSELGPFDYINYYFKLESNNNGIL